jgi:hypothetical protein
LGALLIGALLIKQRGVAALGAGKRRPETEAVGEVTESSTIKQHSLSYTVRPIAALLDGLYCLLHEWAKAALHSIDSAIQREHAFFLNFHSSRRLSSLSPNGVRQSKFICQASFSKAFSLFEAGIAD